MDELADQIRLEFFFKREARVMDTIATHLKDQQSRILVPNSIPGLVSDRLLVMNFLDGVQVGTSLLRSIVTMCLGLFRVS